jgi:SNF2 family DNA or RNA helicase
MPSYSSGSKPSSGPFQIALHFQPGDRLEIAPCVLDEARKRLSVPASCSALWSGGRELIFEDGKGWSGKAVYEAETSSLAWPHWSEILGASANAGRLALQYVEPQHFRVLWDAETEEKDTKELEALPDEIRSPQGVPISLDPGDREMLATCEQEPSRSLRDFRLSLQAAELTSHPGFSQLIGLPMVREMDILEHQTKTAKTVLRRMRGRAMLCDEVGLGKTIEAGLVLSELIIRGLVKSVLVLLPPSLIEQWQAEMRRKFSIDFITHDDPGFRRQGAEAWAAHDRILASFHTAKREPHSSAITQRHWDMVIVDEAHHLRNRETVLWRFASELQKQFILLLTATPVQNNLDELFNLVTLLEPGLLSTAKRFQKEFVDRRDKLAPRNVDRLHELLAEVMVRNQRSTVGLQFTRRWARTERVQPGPAERQLYDEVAAFVQENLRVAGQNGEKKVPLSRMALIVLQMELGSSTQAAAKTLEKMAHNESLNPASQGRLMELSERGRSARENAKAERLLQILEDLPDKLVVFTQFRATQEMLWERLRAEGHKVALFHGGLSRLEKERQIERFRHEERVLLATDSGSEGRNLQFCNAICNFDLPWNPMRIEQRIGRLSRIGQTRDVHVFNLVAADTIEAAILHLLDAKLAMFELVIGEIDMVLGNLDTEQEFSDLVTDLWAESANMNDFTRRMDQLGDRLVAAKAAYFRQRAIENQIFGDKFQPEA